MILREKIKAQSTIEFTFAMVVTVFLIYGLVMVFRWGGMDLVNRRVAQDRALTIPLDTNHPQNGTDPSIQLSSNVGSTVMPMAALYHGNITNGNEIAQ